MFLCVNYKKIIRKFYFICILKVTEERSRIPELDLEPSRIQVRTKMSRIPLIDFEVAAQSYIFSRCRISKSAALSYYHDRVAALLYIAALIYVYCRAFYFSERLPSCLRRGRIAKYLSFKSVIKMWKGSKWEWKSLSWVLRHVRRSSQWSVYCPPPSPPAPAPVQTITNQNISLHTSYLSFLQGAAHFPARVLRILAAFL